MVYGERPTKHSFFPIKPGISKICFVLVVIIVIVVIIVLPSPSLPSPPPPPLLHPPPPPHPDSSPPHAPAGQRHRCRYRHDTRRHCRRYPILESKILYVRRGRRRRCSVVLVQIAVVVVVAMAVVMFVDGHLEMQ